MTEIAEPVLENEHVDRVFAWIRANVPQSRHIERDQVAWWLAAVLRNDPERLGFHLRRLAGIGSSECAVPWLESMGKRDTFLTGRELALDKLMQRAPGLGTRHTRRGQLLESFAMRLFLAQNQLRPDRESRAKILGFRGDETDPWRLGTPDLLAIDRHGRRWLVDIKCPESLSKSGDVNIRYVAQLHHLHDIATRLDIEIDRLAIVELKLDAADFFVQLADADPEACRRCLRSLEQAIVRTGNVPGVDMRIHQIDYDARTAVEIHDACETFWNDYVMKGQAPSFPKQQTLPIDAQKSAELRNLVDFYGTLKHLSAAADDMARRTLAEIGRHAPKQPGQLSAIAASLSMRPQYDGDRLANYLASRGEPIDRYRKYPWDTEKMVEKLREILGDQFNPEDFIRSGKHVTWDVAAMVAAVGEDEREAFVLDYQPVCTKKAEKRLPESFIREISEITEKNAIIFSDRLASANYDVPQGQGDEKRKSPKKRKLSIGLG